MCDPTIFKAVPLFALLDDDETAVLASQVEMKTFTPRQRIYKIGDQGGRGYILVSGQVRVTTIDEDHQEVVVDEPVHGDFFGFASMLDNTPHQTNATAAEPPSASKWTVMTYPSSSSASRWLAWICSLCWAGSFTTRSNWFACAPRATPTS